MILSLGSAAAWADTFTVTSTGDSGAGSLRQAVLDANANPGIDTIAFAIPGAGVPDDQRADGLPHSPLRSSSTARPSRVTPGAPLIELTAAPEQRHPDHRGRQHAPRPRPQGFRDAIRWLLTGGGNLVEGCYIGTNAAGTAGASTGATGIDIRTSATTRSAAPAAAANVISGTTARGILSRLGRTPSSRGT